MNADRKKCLVMFPRVPYPAIGGDKLKGYHMLDILSRHFDVTLVIVTDEPYTAYEAALSYFASIGIQSKCFTYSKPRFYLNALKSLLFGKRPIQTDYYYFPVVQQYIDSIASEYDFVISNLIRTTQYFMNINKPKFLDIVDSIAINYSRSAARSSSKFWSTLYKVEGERVLRYENTCLEKFTATFFVNYYESEDAARRYPNIYWIPNGVTKKIINFVGPAREESRPYIAFFGKMDYQPNIDAVKWFIDNVWPHVAQKPVFYIIGTRADELKQLYDGKNNIVVTGYMEDPYGLLANSDIVVAPMQTGAGIQNKILETMAMGKVVLTTSLGANPIIGASNEVHLIVADEALEYAKKLEDIIQHKEKYQQIGKNARQLIQEQYDWDNYEKKLITMINAHI